MIPKKLDNTISTISYSFFSTSCNFGQTQMLPWKVTTVSICGKYWDRKSNPEEQDTCDKREATTLLKNCHSWEELVQALSFFSCTVILSATLDSALCQVAQLALNFRRWPWRIMACRVISWFQNISKYFHRYFGFIRFTEFVARADPARGDSNWSSDIQMCEGDNQQVILFSFALSKRRGKSVYFWAKKFNARKLPMGKSMPVPGCDAGISKLLTVEHAQVASVFTVLPSWYILIPPNMEEIWSQ